MGSYLDTEISGVLINGVASEEILEEIKDAGMLEPNKIYLTPDEDDSSTGIIIKKLYTGASMSSAGTYSLNESMDNYKMLLFVGAYKISSSYYYFTQLVTVDQYKLFSSTYQFLLRSGENNWIGTYYNDIPNSIKIDYVSGASFISTVYGIK